MHAKRFFLTFPQCGEQDLRATLEHLNEYYPCEWIIVAREKHQDGETHLHIALELIDKHHFRSPDCFDFVTGQHGNYQTMKNMKKCIEYVTKDGDFIAEGIDVAEALSKGVAKTTTYARMVQSGGTLDAIDTIDPGFVLNNKRKLEDYISYHMIKRNAAGKQVWYPIFVNDYQGATREIANWLNDNLFNTNRKLKEPQLYIHGPANMGKTTLVETLAKYCRIYRIPTDEQFYDFYYDGMYDLVVLDEFKAQKTVTWLNEFLQGSEMVLRVKGAQRIKRDNPPAIILSNYTLEEAYRNSDPGKIAPLHERLKIVEVSEFIEIDFDNNISKLDDVPIEEYS